MQSVRLHPRSGGVALGADCAGESRLGELVVVSPPARLQTASCLPARRRLVRGAGQMGPPVWVVLRASGSHRCATFLPSWVLLLPRHRFRAERPRVLAARMVVAESAARLSLAWASALRLINLVLRAPRVCCACRTLTSQVSQRVADEASAFGTRCLRSFIVALVGESSAAPWELQSARRMCVNRLGVHWRSVCLGPVVPPS